uniref:Uncharacterized protein n=1 Tax=viral metagenome TaxID=1070528 RepID=A0A6M3L9T0_9ZZZZ
MNKCWQKCPSVMTEGKQFFWFLCHNAVRYWVVWSRAKKQWVVQSSMESKDLAEFRTPEQGKRYVENLIS